MDHRGDMLHHRTSLNKSGHSIRLWFRCPQVDNFSRVSNFCNDFLNSSFNSNFFNDFFHNRFDNSLFNSLFNSLLHSRRSSWDGLSFNMDTDRQLTTEDCGVVVGNVHCVVDHRGVDSMVDHGGGSVVNDGGAVVDGVMDKGSGVMD